MKLYEVKFRFVHSCGCERCMDRGSTITKTLYVEAENEAEAAAPRNLNLGWEDELVTNSISVNEMGEAERMRRKGFAVLPLEVKP
jgi:hypothetical protein